jgi:hypothetical protein
MNLDDHWVVLDFESKVRAIRSDSEEATQFSVWYVTKNQKTGFNPKLIVNNDLKIIQVILDGAPEGEEGPRVLLSMTDEEEFIQIPRETLERWLKDLESYWYSGDSEDVWNNDEIIEISREIERLLKGQK